MQTGQTNVFPMDVTKLMGDFKVSGFDVDALMALQRKNVEAMTQANQTALEGVGAMVRRQSEIMRETVEAYTQAFGEMMSEGTPEEKMARHADLMKGTYEKSIEGLKEIGTMAAKTQEEAANLINSRVTASFDEAKQMVKAPKKAA